MGRLFPSVTDTYSNLLTGVVTTFNSTLMSGTSIPSAVPLVNVDVLVGRSWKLKPGECQVLYSKSGEYQSVFSNSTLSCYTLGTTMPIAYERNDGYALTSDGSVYYSPGYANGFSLNHLNANFSKVSVANSSSILLRNEVAGPDDSFSPYSWSYVVLVYNRGSTDVTLYVNYGESTAPDIEVPSIPLTSVHWILTYCHTVSYTDPIGSKISVIPHINGNINIYSFPYANILNSSQESAFFSNIL